MTDAEGGGNPDGGSDAPLPAATDRGERAGEPSPSSMPFKPEWDEDAQPSPTYTKDGLLYPSPELPKVAISPEAERAGFFRREAAQPERDPDASGPGFEIHTERGEIHHQLDELFPYIKDFRKLKAAADELAALRAENKTLTEKIDEWKSATLLVTQAGDAADIEPENVTAYIQNLEAKCERLQEQLAHESIGALSVEVQRDKAVKQRDHVRKNLQDATLKCLDARDQLDKAVAALEAHAPNDPVLAEISEEGQDDE